MAYFYADSSGLVKRHITETGSAWMQQLTDISSGNVIATNRISAVELISAFNRRVRDGTLRTADYTIIAADVFALFSGEYEVIEVTPHVVTQAQYLLERHPLRGYDAVQLASAFTATSFLQTAGLPALTFISADARLLAVARAEGLAVDDPNAHP